MDTVVGVRVIVWTGAADGKVTVTGVWDGEGAGGVGVWTGEGVTVAGILVTDTGADCGVGVGVEGWDTTVTLTWGGV